MFGLLSVFLFARLIWTAANTEFGFPFLAQQWERETLGWFVETDPITARSPSAQADFWLAETERVLAEVDDPHRKSMLSMGAAAVLRRLTPTFQYGDDYFVAHNLPRAVKPHSEWDGDPEENRDYFERTKPRARELMLQALRLDPDNVEWSRIRATKWITWDEETPLHEIWDECAKVDPDNALYDFLLAGRLLSDSIEMTSYPDGWTDIAIIDETMVQDAWDAIERGLEKPVWDDEGPIARARLEFLQAANVPASTHEVYWNHGGMWHSDGFLSTRSLLLDLCWRAQLEPRPRVAYEILLTLRQMWEHYSHEPRNALDLFNMEYAVEDAQHLITLMGWFPDEFSTEEVADAKQYAVHISEEFVTRLRARDIWREQFGTKDARGADWGLAEVCYLFALYAPGPFLLLAAIFAIANMTNRWSRPRGNAGGELSTLRAVTGWKTQIALWVLAVVILFALLAVLPARVQAAWHSVVLASVLFGSSLIVLIAVAWRLLRWRRFRFGMRTLLVCMLFLPLLLYGIAQFCLAAVSGDLQELGWQIELYEPALYWAARGGSLDDNLLLVVQWLLRDGLVWMVCAWLGLTMMVTLWKVRWRQMDDEDTVQNQNPRLLTRLVVCMSGNFARGALGMLVILACLYLAIVPNLIQEQEDRLAWIKQHALHPGRYLQKVNVIAEELWANPKVRAELRVQAREQLSKRATPFLRL